MPLNLLHSIRAEVEKPFSEKLAQAKRLIKLYANTGNTCVACSFGKDSMIVLYLALQENPRIPVCFGNTGVEFPETIKLMEKVKKEWDLNLVELKPKKTFWEINDSIMQKKLIMDDGRKFSNICCYHLKERPFHVYAKENGITRSFTGITAVESRNRMFLACQKGMDYYSIKAGFSRVHPIMMWKEQEVWIYTHENNIPVNEAYSKYGIDRIGCMTCMSHKGWREQIMKINPKLYAHLMKRYKGIRLMTEFFEDP